MTKVAGKDPARVNRLVWRTVQKIPSGSVCTYGQVADLAGLGKAARRVGRALRELPVDSDVPWHRVLRAGGNVAFPPDSDAWQRQVDRLSAEGVDVIRGKVDLDRFGWKQSLDALLWYPDA
ncbi:MAG: methylated-DNA--[protein]-cysteine S-methyltransferase [Gammaproteobacteria bacterium]|nr:methylated-DNA--[protein]-cysteine S-methyltransferase [Gammaproteobacteria bacterium]NND59743.1 methylated-DNA--[protein]-cysteine S-methyltransferase [Gammaproteobacteria bacterium]